MHMCAVNVCASVCVCVCICCCCCCCRCVAVWQLHRYRYTQSVGNCCIQRFVRSPTELRIIYSFVTLRIYVVRVSYFVFLARLVSFVPFASLRFVSFTHTLYKCACVCVEEWVRECVCGAGNRTSFNVIVINFITSFRFGRSFTALCCACICSCRIQL